MKSTFQIDKKFLFIPFQLIIFIIFLIPSLLQLNNFFFFLIFIILEIVSFIPIISKKNMKITLYIWQLQIYLLIILNLIFQPEVFLQVEEIEYSVVFTFLILSSLVEIAITLLIFFEEKMVKPLLIGLSSSTTLIVFLIVIFVANEGVHTFDETNPIDFIMGSEWTPLYENPSFDSKTVTVKFDNYDIEIIPDDDSWLISPDKNYTFSTTIKNSGGLADEYHLEESTDKNIICDIDKKYFNLQPGQQQETNITFFTNETGNFQIQLKCYSNQSDIVETKTIDIHSGDFGLNIYPNSRRIKADINDVSYQKAIFKLTNTGIIEDLYKISINHNSKFHPKILELDNWNYSTSTGTITLQPQESKNLTIKPIMTNAIEGEFILDIIVTSLNHPEVQENAVIIFEYVRDEKLLIENRTKTISEFDKALFYFSTDFEKTYDIQIEEVPQNWNCRIIQRNATILDGAGIAEIVVNDRNTAFTLEVSPNGASQSDIANITIKLGDRGSSPSFGIFSFIISSAITTIIAIAIAGPLGLFVAIFLSEFCHKKISPILRFIFDLLAGIPSVVYGFWGFFTLVPFFGEKVFPLLFGMQIMTGRTILTASFVLSIMILPIVIALSNDAIKSVEKKLTNGSLALGATKWQTVKHIILPKAKSGIIASIILATGRAIGETMAVLMILGGNTAQIPLKYPDTLLSQTHTMTSIIAQTFPDGVGYEKTKYALFGIALILFLIIFALNIIIYYIQKEKKKKNWFEKIIRNKRLGIIFKNNKWKKSKNNSESIDKKFSIVDIEKEKRKKFIVLDSITQNTDKKSRFYGRVQSGLFSDESIIKSTKKAVKKEKIVKIGLYIIAILSTSFLFFILGEIIINGITGFRLEFLTQTETLIGGGYEGGFANAIVGSLQLVAIGLAVSVPLSLGSAIYIVEYAKKDNIFTRIILFTSDTLASTPSIVFGAFGFIFLIMFLKFDKSLFAGGLTLGFMVIPLLLRSSIESLKSVPDSFREGSYALGATQWQTIKNVVIPPASPGISSGLILGIGRAIGETAAILFTAGYFVHFATSILHPAASLPNLIYQYYRSASVFPGLEAKLYSAVLVLIVIVIILNLTSKWIAHRSSKMMNQ